MAGVGMWASFGIYMVMLLAIGAYFWITDKREMKRLTDYLLASREGGTWTTAFSQVASVASGFTFFAWVGLGYLLGISALWYALFTVFFQLFTWRFVAPRFRNKSEEYDSLTMVDHLARHFGRRGEQRNADIIRVLGTIIVVAFLGVYLGAQMVAIGTTAEAGLGLNYMSVVIVGGLVVAIYTFMGGFNASLWTDYLQGWLMIIAAIAFPIAAVSYAGGWGPFLDQVSAAGGALNWNGGQSGVALFLFLAGWFTFGMGMMGQPHAMQRFQAIESERLLSRGAVIAAAVSAIRMTFPIFIGLSGYVVLDEVTNPEHIMVEGLPTLFPDVIAGLFMAGIVSAILSTTDSMLILSSSELTRNVYERFINDDASQQRLIWVGRSFVVLFMALAIVIAWAQPASIFGLIAFGWTGLGAGLGAALLFVLLWSRTTAWGVVAGMVVGLGATVWNQIYLPDHFPVVVYPVTFAVIIIVSYVEGSLSEQSPSGMDAGMGVESETD